MTTIELVSFLLLFVLVGVLIVIVVDFNYRIQHLESIVQMMEKINNDKYTRRLHR